MATLNVRERRFETTIAYMGLSGATLEPVERAAADEGFGKLGRSRRETPALAAVSWVPARSRGVDECGVVVDVVAPLATEGEVLGSLRDADGLVWVLDADPAAVGRARASLEVLRDELARAGRKRVPGVLQLEGAMASEVVAELAESSGLSPLEIVGSGAGAAEALEAALEDILAGLRRTNEARPDDGAGQLGEAEKDNPLLSALRGALRETLDAHARLLEERTVGRMLAEVDGAQRRGIDEVVSVLDARGCEVAAEIERARRDLAAVGAAVEAHRAEQAAHIERRFEVVEVAVGARLGALAAAMERVDGRIGLLEASLPALASLEASVGALADRDDLVAATEAAGAAAVAASHDLRAALEVRARQDREQNAAISAALRRSMEGLAREVHDVGRTDALDALSARIDRLEEAVREPAVLERLVARVERIEAAVRDQGKLEAVLRGHQELGERQTALAAAVAAIDAQLCALTEELKRPKKGWFA
jgi:hypothetical protein